MTVLATFTRPRGKAVACKRLDAAVQNAKWPSRAMIPSSKLTVNMEEKWRWVEEHGRRQPLAQLPPVWQRKVKLRIHRRVIPTATGASVGVGWSLSEAVYEYLHHCGGQSGSFKSASRSYLPGGSPNRSGLRQACRAFQPVFDSFQ